MVKIYDKLVFIERNEDMSAERLNGDFKEALKREIEIKKNILSGMILKGIDKDIILKFSQELDELIGKYQRLDLDIK